MVAFKSSRSGTSLRASLALTGLLLAACSETQAARPFAGVSLGVDELLTHHIELVAGKRVGLITNPSGVDSWLVPTADRLAEDGRFELVRLFGPEHGIRGDVPAGDKVGDRVDPRTGVPVDSLYGSQRRPSAESLADLDVLLFDIQDVGSRLYTYISTLGEAMIAAAEADVPLIVLDRPNPIGGVLFEGPVREEQWKSFIGWGPMPVTHGMTVGEVALFFENELELGCDLHVVPMRGWRRSMVWSDTRLRWTQTSPHIPHALNAQLYAATGMVASVTTNVSDGVGSTMPFELIGAEFIEPRELAQALTRRALPGVRFQEISWKPFYGDFEGRGLRGVRLILDAPREFRPLRTALTMLVVLHEMYPEELALKDEAVFAKHWGNEQVRADLLAGSKVDEIQAAWTPGLEAFARARAEALIYPD